MGLPDAFYEAATGQSFIEEPDDTGTMVASGIGSLMGFIGGPGGATVHGMTKLMKVAPWLETAGITASDTKDFQGHSSRIRRPCYRIYRTGLRGSDGGERP